MMNDLAYISGLRGMDSTGVYQFKFYQNKVQNELLVKEANDIGYFQWKHKWTKEGNRKILNDTACIAVLAHVRAATRGSINLENTHPFEFPNMVAMHNGTLVSKKYQSNEKTDSEMLFADMSERGIHAVLSELDEKDAYAIVIADRQTGQLFFSRNKERTLYFAQHASRDVLFWASEEWMLRGIFKRHGQEILDNKIIFLHPDTIVKVDPKDISCKNEKFWTTETVERPQKVVTYAHKGKSVAPFQKKGQGKTSEGRSDVKGKNKIPVFHCAQCQCPTSLVDYYRSKTYRASVYICDDCNSTPWTVNNKEAETLL